MHPTGGIEYSISLSAVMENSHSAIANPSKRVRGNVGGWQLYLWSVLSHQTTLYTLSTETNQQLEQARNKALATLKRALVSHKGRRTQHTDV